jgi:GxxExxY protein
MDTHFRRDLVVRGDLIVELKRVERLLPVHQAQLITVSASRGGDADRC